MERLRGEQNKLTHEVNLKEKLSEINIFKNLKQQQQKTKLY